MIFFEFIAGIFLLIGSLFVLIGSFGLYSLPFFFTRLHAPTNATTLGVGSILIGSIIYFAAHDDVSLHELLIVLFLFATAPVSAHMMSKAGMQQRLPVIKKTYGNPWKE
jgi:multicomponent K+:H+ antiporter subunit G